MDTIASIENERLHLGIPPLRLVSEMNTGIQQFLYANTNHRLPLVRSSPTWRTIPGSTGLFFSVVMAANAYTALSFGPFILSRAAKLLDSSIKEPCKIPKHLPVSTLILAGCPADARANCAK